MRKEPGAEVRAEDAAKFRKETRFPRYGAGEVAVIEVVSVDELPGALGPEGV